MIRRIRTAIMTVATLASVASAVPAMAQDDLVVVELFTSQGCSSCPPADALLAELAEVEGVLPLALHVDYWDYIGWKDDFAQAQFTDRQRGYAKAAGKRSIYTPQMVVQGLDHVVGYKPMKLADSIERLRQQASTAPVVMAAERAGDSLRISVRADGDLPAPMVVHLVRFDPMQTVQIGRGENAGRSVDYANIVTHWESIAQWDGRAPLSLDVDAPGAMQTAVLLQSANHGPILAAVRAE